MYICVWGRTQNCPTILKKQKYISGISKNCAILFGKTHGSVSYTHLSLLIKGNKCEQKWHVWYERGVENKLRVTRLYEYYLLSTDLSRDVEPPKSVLLYFAYQCNLDWEYAAWLYSCVERCKTKDPELYITYKPELDHFRCV